ncbi:MAG: TIM barrel protein [Brevinematales bacterium]|nr:TIM barrel protein [Brevinematales bacterium]
MDRLYFLTAGIPISARPRTLLNGLRRIKALGLDGMELEFGRGIRQNFPLMKQVGLLAKELGLVLTAHAPYTINLNSKDPKIIEKSYQAILETARSLDVARGWSMVFHPGYYLGEQPRFVFPRIQKHLEHIVQLAGKEALRVWIRPELMGKKSQFGTLYELVEMSANLGGSVLPCIDLSHWHARTGKNNSYDEVERILKMLDHDIGGDVLKNMHIHFSGIEYGESGERRHTIFRKSDVRYREILKVLYDYDAGGALVCESPNVEGDLLMLKLIYDSF